MTTIIVLLSLLGMTAFVAASAGSNFKGSSQTAYMLLNTAGSIGYIAYFAFIIWGFFKFPWWVSVISLVVPFLFIGFITPLVKMAVARIVSIILVPILIGWLLMYYL